MKLRKAFALILLSILGLGLPIFGLSVIAHGGAGTSGTSSTGTIPASWKAGEQPHPPFLRPASLLRGAVLVTEEGNPAGQVLDLVVEPRKNRVVSLVVAQTLQEEADARVTAIPYELVALEVSPDATRWRVHVDRTALTEAPGVDLSDEEAFRRGGWLAPVRSHFGLAPLPELADREALPRPELVPSRALEVSARGRTGEHLGRVDEVVFEVTGARVAYIVVGRQKGVLGKRARRAAVPWTLARLVQSSADETPHAYVISLAADDAALEAAPPFQGDDWERMGDPRYLRELFDHYGVDPRDIDNAEQRSGAAPRAAHHPQQLGSGTTFGGLK